MKNQVSMAENFPSLEKVIDIQVLEAQRASNKMNSRKKTPVHIVNKIAKIKDIES